MKITKYTIKKSETPKLFCQKCKIQIEEAWSFGPYHINKDDDRDFCEQCFQKELKKCHTR